MDTEEYNILKDVHEKHNMKDKQLQTMKILKPIIMGCVHNWRMSYNDETKIRFWYCTKCRLIEEVKKSEDKK